MSEIPNNPSESIKRRNPHLYTLGFCPGAIERIRQQKKLLNKLETEFYHLLQKQPGDIHAQALRFMLGNGIWYKPDFVVIVPIPVDAVVAYEVKGPKSWRGGFENLKVAANMFRWITWKLVWKENASWNQQTVLPAV
jgi:hypothetical protein